MMRDARCVLCGKPGAGPVCESCTARVHQLERGELDDFMTLELPSWGFMWDWPGAHAYQLHACAALITFGVQLFREWCWPNAAARVAEPVTSRQIGRRGWQHDVGRAPPHRSVCLAPQPRELPPRPGATARALRRRALRI